MRAWAEAAFGHSLRGRRRGAARNHLARRGRQNEVALNRRDQRAGRCVDGITHEQPLLHAPPDHTRKPARHAVERRREPRPDLLLPQRLAAQQDPARQRLGIRVCSQAQVEIDEPRNFSDRVSTRSGEPRFQIRIVTGDQIAERSEQDLLLAAEVVMDEPRGQASRLRDVRDRSAVVAALRHHLHQRADDLRLSLVGIGGSGHGRRL